VANPTLTDNFIKTLTAPAGKRVEIFDQKISGLVLRVSSQGRKTWVLRYRTDSGRQPRFTIGTYPALKLADARDEALRLSGSEFCLLFVRKFWVTPLTPAAAPRLA
jgi:hypothetical protein